MSVSAELALREGMQDLHTSEMLREMLLALQGDRTVADHTNCGGVYVERESRGQLHLQPPLTHDLIAQRSAQDKASKTLRSMPSILHPYGAYINVHSDRAFSGVRGNWDEAGVTEVLRKSAQLYGHMDKRRRVVEGDKGVGVKVEDAAKAGVSEAESKT
ncbi:hypothetical protein EON64_14870 [archaeon]|nr:MAG: hypothetical protein EON64_14870 [archaeon]